MSIEIETNGFLSLEQAIKKYQKLASNAKEAVSSIADQLVADLLKLPKPVSRLGGSHTHMVHTFAKEVKGSETVVGWGAYYGRMVEKGTVKMGAQPHMLPTWQSNEGKYIGKMLKEYSIE